MDASSNSKHNASLSLINLLIFKRERGLREKMRGCIDSVFTLLLNSHSHRRPTTTTHTYPPPKFHTHPFPCTHFPHEQLNAALTVTHWHTQPPLKDTMHTSHTLHRFLLTAPPHCILILYTQYVPPSLSLTHTCPPLQSKCTLAA